MQEVTVGAPRGQGEQVAQLALAQGIQEASVSSARLFKGQKSEEIDEIKVEVSAPEATRFIEALMAEPYFDPQKYSIVSDEVTAVVTSERPEQVARPFKLSSVAILQDLWIQNHVTAPYIARAAVSALLLAYGLIEGDMTVIIVSLLFSPFLTQVLALAFGGWMGDWRLARQGAGVLGLTTVIAIAAGAIVAAVMGGPLTYDDFGTLYSNLAISALVGVIAGLDTADEAGRREFVAVAGAAQFTAFPVWLGISLVLGFPDSRTTLWRVVTPLANVVAILIASLVTYVALRYRRENIRRYVIEARQSG